jgi:hypothetical protein
MMQRTAQHVADAINPSIATVTLHVDDSTKKISVQYNRHNYYLNVKYKGLGLVLLVG